MRENVRQAAPQKIRQRPEHSEYRGVSALRALTLGWAACALGVLSFEVAQKIFDLVLALHGSEAP